MDSIFSFSRENFREGIPDCVGASGGRHGVCWWWDWVGRGCDGGTVVRGVKIDGVVVGTTEDTVVTKGVTGGNGLVTEILG